MQHPLWPVLAASAFQIKASVSVPQTSYLADDQIINDNREGRGAEISRLVAEKLSRVAAGYRTHGDKMKRTLEMELELSSKVEKCYLGGSAQHQNDSLLLLSAKLKEKQHLLEECLETNDQVVHQLLATADGGNEIKFQSIAFVPTAAVESNGEHDDLGQLMGNGGMMEQGEKTKETDGYDTALQVIHHTSRDWTAGAAPCRDATIGWIVRSIVQYSHASESNPLRVLVPGAGLGRLAYDISTCEELDANVEANDSSVTMIFAARQMLEMLQKRNGEQIQRPIYPFLSDPQVNEIDGRKRFEMETFPDDDAVASYQRYHALRGTEPNLSYTVGDFVSTYSQQTKQSQYDVVATSFFIDTATNIYEYVHIMKHLLDGNSQSSPSLWVNCGPIQWHPCALLRPTVEELKGILQSAGFELLAWEVADEAMAYRHPDDMGGNGLQARYTRSEAYRPLRFVARLNSAAASESIEDLPLKIQYSGYLHEIIANGKAKL